MPGSGSPPGWYQQVREAAGNVEEFFSLVNKCWNESHPLDKKGDRHDEGEHGDPFNDLAVVAPCPGEQASNQDQDGKCQDLISQRGFQVLFPFANKVDDPFGKIFA